jgi:hypothetical protein
MGAPHYTRRSDVAGGGVPLLLIYLPAYSRYSLASILASPLIWTQSSVIRGVATEHTSPTSN